ncbi:MAG: o-succinylbenzoate synthase [Verrucomicrobiota bacterium]
MNISSWTLFHYEFPLVRPTTVKGGGEQTRGGLLLRVQHDAGEGWGEIAPLPGYSRESRAEARMQLLEVLPRGLATDIPLLPSVRFGLDMACRVWPAEEIEIPINILLDGNIDEVMASAEAEVENGATCFKLKVGRKPVEDEIRMVEAVRHVIGSCELRLDANRAWTLEEARAFLPDLARYDIEYIEEPVQDGFGLEQLIEENLCPIALDETLSEATDLEPFAGARALVIKPSMVGGWARTRELAQIGESLGAYPVISSIFESGVGHRCLARMAAALPRARPRKTSGIEYGQEQEHEHEVAVGLDTYRWIQKDVLVEPIEIRSGFIRIGNKCRVDIDRLTELCHG